MSLTRSRWVLPVLSACTAAAMFASPIAWADDDKGRGGGDRGRGDEEGRRVTFLAPAPATTVVQRRDDDDENEDRDERVVVASATPLVNAINNEVAALSNMNVDVDDEDEDEAEAEEVEVEDVTTVTLVGLETRAGLTGAEAQRVTDAVNANFAALQAFLGSNTPAANRVNAILSAAGINPANVRALLFADEHELLAVIG
jgi:hypothetical protein